MLQRTIGNRATVATLARAPTATAGLEFTLLYKDEYGDFTDEDGDVQWRPIKLDDPEFQHNYVDYGIDRATVAVTLDTGEYRHIVVHYRDGRRLVFDKDDIPSYRRRAPRKGVSVTTIDAFERHEKNGFVFPSYKGEWTLSDQLTPNLVSLREQADEKAEQLAKLRELMWVAGAFANIVAMYGAVAGQSPGAPRRPTMTLRSPGIRRPSLQHVVPAKPPPSRPQPAGGPPKPKVPMALPEPGARPQAPRRRPGHEPADGKGAPKTPRRPHSRPRPKPPSKPGKPSKEAPEDDRQTVSARDEDKSTGTAPARPQRTDKIGARGYPLGFKSRGQFKQFGESARGTLKKLGFDDVEVGMQGSAVTGRSASDGAPFDGGRMVSDLDLAVVSPKLFARVRDAGVPVRDGHTRFALKPEDAARVGIGEVPGKLSRLADGRTVNVMVFESRAAAVAKEAATIWAR